MSSSDTAPFGVTEVVSSAVAIFFGCIVIGLRIWGRKIKRSRVTLSDYITISALMTIIVRFALKIYVYRWMIRSQNGNLAIPAAHAMRSAQLIFASEVVFAISLAFVKISILSGYHELFFVLIWIKRFVWFMIAICILLLVTNTAGLLTMCSPIETNYDPGVKGHCRISQSVDATISTAINIAVDIILVVIPLCVVWMLKINLLKKVGISFMFGLGLLIVIVAGLRIHTYGAETMSYNHRLALLSSLELHLSLIAACLPFIGPSIGRIGEMFLCTSLDENEFRRSKCMGPDLVENISS